MDFQESGKPVVKSLPCVKGGGTRQRDGGIVIQRKHKNNPSVSFADSSLYTREPFLASAPPSTSHSSLEDEDLGGIRQRKGLGETRLLRRGRSLGGPTGETFPGTGPHFLHTVLQIRYARGSAPGNFFWGRLKYLGERAGAIPEPSAVDFQWSADGRVSGTIHRGFTGVRQTAR